jgi:hypothetical protein
VKWGEKSKFQRFEGVITFYWVMNVQFLLDHDVIDGHLEKRSAHPRKIKVWQIEKFKVCAPPLARCKTALRMAHKCGKSPMENKMMTMTMMINNGALSNAIFPLQVQWSVSPRRELLLLLPPMRTCSHRYQIADAPRGPWFMIYIHYKTNSVCMEMQSPPSRLIFHYFEGENKVYQHFNCVAFPDDGAKQFYAYFHGIGLEVIVCGKMRQERGIYHVVIPDGNAL